MRDAGHMCADCAPAGVPDRSGHAEVLGSLRPWSAAPPKLRPGHPSPPEVDDTVPAALVSADYSSQDEPAEDTPPEAEAPEEQRPATEDHQVSQAST